MMGKLEFLSESDWLPIDGKASGSKWPFSVSAKPGQCHSPEAGCLGDGALPGGSVCALRKK